MRVTVFGASELLGKALMPEWKGKLITRLSSGDADTRRVGRDRLELGYCFSASTMSSIGETLPGMELPAESAERV